MGVIPFYGADEPELFAIERRAMDRDGLVIDALHELLPPGLVLDVGAGDGFTADDVYTYFFDDVASCWRALQRVSVDEAVGLLVD